MDDLQIAPPREKSVLPAILIATLVLAAIGAAIFYFNPHKTAELSVLDVHTFAPHTELGALQSERSHDMRVLGAATASSEDDLYVVATVSLADKLRMPLFFEGGTAQVTFADGTEANARMIPATDVKRLGTIFPDITPMIRNPITDGEQIDPGQTRVGTLVLGFPGRTADAWQKKQNATLTMELRNQEPQTTRLP